MEDARTPVRRTRRQPPSLAGVREALQWIAREWKDEQTQRAFASDCDPPALRWYWACDGTQ